jgi:hypothetical protein
VKKEDDVATKKITAEDDVELQRLVDRAVGPSDLMEFMRLDKVSSFAGSLAQRHQTSWARDGGS